MTENLGDNIHYPFVIRPLTNNEGSGYLIKFPDLPGCMSDGETIEEAIAMGKDAVNAWISTAKAMKRPIPKPGLETTNSENNYSGKFVQRIPKSLHAELAKQAEKENVSLNTLVLSYISRGLGESSNLDNTLT